LRWWFLDGLIHLIIIKSSHNPQKVRTIHTKIGAFKKRVFLNNSCPSKEVIL